jgi:heptaprenyl diphosphate synthase
MGKSKKVALLGLLLALVVVLGMLENMLPAIPLLPPNVRLGLANTVSMYCIFFIGKREALLLTVTKSAFVFLTRGPIAALLSLSGGLLSLVIIIVAWYGSKHSLSYITYSILGAVSHNIGQIAAFSLLMKNEYMLYYLPVLLVFGIVMGTVTGILLKAIMPYFNHLVKYEHSE